MSASFATWSCIASLLSTVNPRLWFGPTDLGQLLLSRCVALLIVGRQRVNRWQTKTRGVAVWGRNASDRRPKFLVDFLRGNLPSYQIWLRSVEIRRCFVIPTGFCMNKMSAVNTSSLWPWTQQLIVLCSYSAVNVFNPLTPTAAIWDSYKETSFARPG